MTTIETQNEFAALAHIEDIARLALVDIRDDATWNGLTVSWSKP
jgi:hypothetical protein